MTSLGKKNRFLAISIKAKNLNIEYNKPKTKKTGRLRDCSRHNKRIRIKRELKNKFFNLFFQLGGFVNMKKISVAVVLATILGSIPIYSEADSKSEVSGKILSETIAGVDEKADLTREQLRDCLLLKQNISNQAETIKQLNSNLELLQDDIDERSRNIKERRSLLKSLSQTQLKSLNQTITQQNEAIDTYNKKIGSAKEKVANYNQTQELFSTTCANKSYDESDMQSVLAEMGQEKKVEKGKKSDAGTVNESKPEQKPNGQYSLTVNPIPVEAKVRIMNIVPKYKHNILLKPGKYDISVTYPNYREYRKWIEIKEANLSIDVILKEK